MNKPLNDNCKPLQPAIVDAMNEMQKHPLKGWLRWLELTNPVKDKEEQTKPEGSIW